MVETNLVGVGEAVATALAGSGVRRLIAPDGLRSEWLAAARDEGIEIIPDTGPRSATDLDAVDAVVTAAAVGIASTGTIVLDHGPDQGRRALILVPDLHVCVIRDDQLLADVHEAVQRLQTSVNDGRPLTWISGPSATSDIKLDRARECTVHEGCTSYWCAPADRFVRPSQGET